MEAGRLTQYQLCAWSQKRPHEVPLIDGELAWIVYRTTEWVEAAERDRPSREPARCVTSGGSVLECQCPACEERRGRATERLRADGVL